MLHFAQSPVSLAQNKKNTIMLLRFWILLFSVSLLFACQSDNSSAAKEEAATAVFDQATKPLFARFYLRYLERDKRLKTTVNFFQRGNNRQMPTELSSGVTIEERNMKFKNLKDIELRYENLHDVEAKEAYAFQFRTLDGVMQTYAAKMPLIKSFAVKTDISKATGFVLEVEAEPLLQGEALLLMITDGERHTETITIFGPMDIDKIPISARQVKFLTVGRNEFRLVRKSDIKIKEKSFSGVCNADYYSEPIFVEVTE